MPNLTIDINTQIMRMQCTMRYLPPLCPSETIEDADPDYQLIELPPIQMGLDKSQFIGSYPDGNYYFAAMIGDQIVSKFFEIVSDESTLVAITFK